MKKLINHLQDNVFKIATYFSITRIKGGKRFHAPISSFFMGVNGKIYYILGILFIEFRIYTGKHELVENIEDETLMKRKTSILVNYMKRRDMVSVSVMKSKLRLTSDATKKLAKANGFKIEDENIYKL